MSLDAAIALDNEFGLRQDADDNARVLAQWTGIPADKAIVPTRAVTLDLWFPHDAHVNVRAVESDVIDRKLWHGEVDRGNSGARGLV
jgi:hypothetical protein